MPQTGIHALFKAWTNRHYILHWLGVIAVAILLFAAFYYIDRINSSKFHQQERAEVIAELGVIRSQLEGKMFSNLQTVQGLVAAITVEPEMSQARFEQFARPLIDKRTQLRNIGAAPDMVIRLVYPLEGNEGVLGLNYLEHPQQRAAAIQVRDSGQPLVAGPISLIQGGTGFVGRIPVFLERNANNEPAKFWGLVSAVIDAESLYIDSGLYSQDLTIDIAIRGNDGTGVKGEIFFGDPTVFDKKPQTLTLNLPGGTWQIAAIPVDGWATRADNSGMYRLVLLLIAIVVLIPFIVIAKIAQKRSYQQQLLLGLFDLSPIGISLTDFASGKFIDANDAAVTPTGYSREEFLSMNYWQITPERYKNEEEQQLKKLRKHWRYGPYEKTYIKKDGTEYPVLLNGILVKDTSGKLLIWSMIEDISVRKRAELLLEEKNRQLELVIAGTAVGIWDWHIPSGRCVFNERWAEIIGYKLEELQPIDINTWLSHAHPDDLAKSERSLQDHWQGATKHYVCEARMKHKDGHDVWVLDTGTVVEWDKDHKPVRMVGTHLDITRQKTAERKLHLANNDLQRQMIMLQAIAEAQSGTLIQKNVQGVFDKLLTTILELTSSEYGFIGEIFYKDEATPWLKTHAISNISWNEETLNFYNENAPQGLEFTNLNTLFGAALIDLQPVISNNPEADPRSGGLPEGHPTMRSFLALPVVREGKGTALIGIANRPQGYDQNLIEWLEPLVITIGQIIDNVRIIRARDKTKEELIAARITAELAAKAKSEFLAVMSHEIRTPMNGVIGMLDLLRTSQLDQEQLRKLDIAKGSADLLLALINDILDFSKIDAGKVELEHLDFDLQKLLKDAVESMSVSAQQKNLKIFVDTTQIHHQDVTGDPTRLRQIVINLISNAIKFTEHGEIKVQADISSLSESKLNLQVSITDTGIGIEEEKIASLFTPFTQVDASTTRKYGGTGLGLAICKKLCEQMGGNIGCQSEPGRGSCFTFSVQLDKSNRVGAEQHTSEPLQPGKPEDTHFWPKNARILLVEDNEINQEVVCMMLEDFELQIEIANNGEEALTYLRDAETNTPFALVLMDCQMPVLDGYQTSEAIRNGEAGDKNRSIPIVAMTANAMEGDREKCLAAGMDDYLSKPIELDAILAMLKRWLLK